MMGERMTPPKRGRHAPAEDRVEPVAPLREKPADDRPRPPGWGLDRSVVDRDRRRQVEIELLGPANRHAAFQGNADGTVQWPTGR